MRMLLAVVSVFVASLFSSFAHAESEPFCERVAKDFANANSSDVDTWLTDYRTSLGICAAQYKADAKVELPASKPALRPAEKSPGKIVIAPANAMDIVANRRSAPLLPPGSIEWNNYCAAKYASFNRLTGYYKAKGGRERRCIESLN
jgi:hypothetical protein